MSDINQFQQEKQRKAAELKQITDELKREEDDIKRLEDEIEREQQEMKPHTQRVISLRDEQNNINRQLTELDKQIESKRQELTKK